MGELTKRAWAHNVQVMVEGPGHVPLGPGGCEYESAADTSAWEHLSMYLGPLVTDIAPGYDHITAAIGGAVAAMSWGRFPLLRYAQQSIWLCLMSDDAKQGIIASKIAAHAADIAKGIPGS